MKPRLTDVAPTPAPTNTHGVAFFAFGINRPAGSQDNSAAIRSVGHDYFVTDVTKHLLLKAHPITSKRTIPHFANVCCRNE
ncbi:hypothetical protein [Paraburkholderia graminis]|uniref:hypothetical protein n=1 Tax=Paraburkholderia graminis TaxID=60548 RepID=UPI0038BD0983